MSKKLEGSHSIEQQEEGEGEEEEEEDGINHSDQYYRNLLKSLQHMDSSPQQNKHQITIDLDERSPFLALKKLNSQARRQSNLHKEWIAIQKMKMQREQKRMEFLCAKEAQDKVSLSKQTKYQLNAMISTKQSRLEREVERKLLQPLRQDRLQFQYLVRKVEEWKDERNRIFERPVTAISPEERQQRHDRAKERRESMAMTMSNASPNSTMIYHEHHHRPAEDSSSPPPSRIPIIANLPMLVISQSAPPTARDQQPTLQEMLQSPRAVGSPRKGRQQRGRQWLIIWVVMMTSSLLGKGVQAIRMMKESNAIAWKAVITIQRAWRKRYKPPTLSPLEKIRRSMNSKDVGVFMRRIDAVQLIERFLVETRIPATFRRIIRQIKSIQKFARSFRTFKQHRLQLLQSFMEAMIQPLAFHINLICSGHGLDLKNLSPLEASQIRMQVSNNKVFRIVREMATPEFHSFLRLNLSRILDFHSDLVASNKLWNDCQSIRKLLLEQLLHQKRKDYLNGLEKINPKVYQTQKVTLDDARNFILYDNDIVADHLEEVDMILTSYYEKKFYRQRKKKKKQAIIIQSAERRRGGLIDISSQSSSLLLSSSKKKKQQKSSSSNNNSDDNNNSRLVKKKTLMLLLGMITPKELLLLFCDMMETFKDARLTQVRAALAVNQINNNNNNMTQQSLPSRSSYLNTNNYNNNNNSVEGTMTSSASINSSSFAGSVDGHNGDNNHRQQRGGGRRSSILQQEKGTTNNSNLSNTNIVNNPQRRRDSISQQLMGSSRQPVPPPSSQQRRSSISIRSSRHSKGGISVSSASTTSTALS